MGIYHSVCAVSSLGIVSETVILVFVAKVGGSFLPLALPVYGDYDSYGSVDNPALLETELAMLRGFVDLNKRGEIQFAEQHEFGMDVSTQNLQALINEVHQGSIFESARKEDTPSTLVQVRGSPLGFVFILSDIYDAVVKTVREAVGDERIDALTDSAFPALIAEAMGSPSLSSAFFDDSLWTRGELADFVLFRSWFDARRTWEPSFTGDQCSQFTRAELRERISNARGTRTVAKIAACH